MLDWSGMSVSFPSAPGGASYDPSTYLSNPAAAIADPVDSVDLTSVGKPPAVTASTAASATPSTPASSGGTSNAGTSNAGASGYGTGNNSLSSLYGTGNSGTANAATSNLSSLLDPSNASTSNSITSNLAGYLNPTANGNPSTGASKSTGSSTATSAAASASNASAWQQEYQNFLTDNTEYLLENTFGSSTALDQPSAAFGSSAAISAITNSTLGVLSQAAALQNPQTLAFSESSTGASSTGSTVDTTA